jgi:glycolate oxidase FAD binding subunit
VNDALSIAGSTPYPVRQPATLAEVGQLVREARSQNQGVYPVGGRTLLDLGRRPTKPGFALDTTKLADVVDYPARDMTITAQAGITIAKLQEVLAKENQWLPIDVPNSERATLGGALATNTSGPHRYGYGTLRDYVIGIGFITEDGVEVKGGGRVVKNVAGYDFMKLQTGALGTLGIITHVTLKVKPRPEANIAVLFSCSSAQLGSVLDLLHKSNSRPVAVELLNAPASEGVGVETSAEWVIAVGYEEKAVTVEWQKSTVMNELKTQGIGTTQNKTGSDAARLWQAIVNLQTHAGSAIISKATVKPSLVAERMLAEYRDEVLLHAQPLNGILWHHSEPKSSDWQIRRGAAPSRDGAEWELMKHIKKTLDPNDLFNPGRLFG